MRQEDGGKGKPEEGRKVECRFKDDRGQCTGRYEGYACLEDKCPFYRMILEEKCKYLRDGGYCTYFKRFHCPGLGKCEATFGMRLVEKDEKDSPIVE